VLTERRQAKAHALPVRVTVRMPLNVECVTRLRTAFDNDDNPLAMS